jgi:uncharacterized repeat protein (TIGR01451 family)
MAAYEEALHNVANQELAQGRAGASLKLIYLLLALASLLWVVGWQDTPPLSLRVDIDPPVVSRGGTLTITLGLTNLGDRPLEAVRVEVVPPEGTAFREARVDKDGWETSAPPSEADGLVSYQGSAGLAAGESVQLVLVVTVLPEAGDTIVFDRYRATAQGMEAPLAGHPVTVRVETTPTPRPTPTVSPTATATAVTPTLTPTVTTAPTRTPSPTPTPTITVVAVELPPTPTPRLTSEQERLGTVTILVFVGIVAAVVTSSVVWLIRGRSV